MDSDAWADLNQRYRQDERAQFLLFVEQMDEGRQLLLNGQLAKLRLGLIAIDNLAEILLYRQQRRIAELRDSDGYAQIPRLNERRLRKLRADFRARVALAETEILDPLLASAFVPILDQLDADVFRSAHAYRGRIYHGDHHNPAALPLLARAYLGAVGRAFTRQQPSGVAGSPDATTAEICAYGFDLADSWAPGYFAPGEAAEAITKKLAGELEVSLGEAKEVLAADIVKRSEWAEEMIESVVTDGFPRERVAEALAEGEPWKEIEADEEIIRLEDEIAAIRAARLKDYTEVSMREEAELMKARNERVWSLRRELKPSVSVGDISRIRDTGARLTNAKNLGSLFNRYRKLDEEIEGIERKLEELAIGWDRHLQEEVDRMKGK